MLTFGTGIGSALFVDGALVPNTELGHLELDGVDAEDRASDRARETEDLDWPDWAERVQRYLSHVEGLVWPDLIIIGGGVSKKADRWLPHVNIRTPGGARDTPEPRRHHRCRVGRARPLAREVAASCRFRGRGSRGRALSISRSSSRGPRVASLSAPDSSASDSATRQRSTVSVETCVTRLTLAVLTLMRAPWVRAASADRPHRGRP